MNDVLTFNDIVDLPKKLVNIAKGNTEYCDLLSDYFLSQHYHKNMKKELFYYFERFKDIKYYYKFPKNVYSKISLQNNVSKYNNHINDIVGNLVENSSTDSVWLENFYKCMLNISSKLTFQEAIYLVDTFFVGHSEEMISEKLGICRATLQKIKKSCIVKLWLEFNYLH